MKSITSFRNKPRLELALYSRPKHPGSYHYALFVAPKSAEGPITKHHVKNTLQVDDAGEAVQPWRYEQAVISDVETERRLLVRVIVAKLAKSNDHVQRILQSVPVYQVEDLDKDKSQTFSCRTWARDALQELREQGAVITKLKGWEDTEQKALEYMDKKQQQMRWDGAAKPGSGVPLMDLIAGKEIVE